MHFGGDVGVGNAWRAGISRLSADASDRASTFPGGVADFTGSSDLTIVDFVWKWARNGNPRDRYFVVQGEYLHRKEHGTMLLPQAVPAPVGAPYDGTQSGYYLQGVISSARRAGGPGCASTISTRATTSVRRSPRSARCLSSRRTIRAA